MSEVSLEFSGRSDRPLQNIDAEEGVLGGILLDPSAISVVANMLPRSAFYITAHQRIYQAALALHSKNKLVDLMSVTTWLVDHELLEKVGGQFKLAQLLERTVSVVNIDRYAELILDKYQRRQLIAAANEVIILAEDTSTELETVLEHSEQKIFEATKYQSDRFEPESIAECLIAAFNQLEGGETSGISTGLFDLDGLTGGLIRQDLIVIAARASMGKTWLACHLSNHLALEGMPVVFFSAEMSKSQLTKRFLAMHSKIDSQRLIQNKIYKSEWEVLTKAVGTIAELPIIIDDTPASAQTPSRMRSVLRRIQSERGQLGLVVLDYIQKLGNRAAGNRAQVIGSFSGAFKDMAKEFDVPFVCLAQINRGVEGQTNKRPTMADIKDSGDIEQDMDLGLLLYREEYYNSDTPDKGVMEIAVAKNRNGPAGVCKVLFNPSVGLFSDFVSQELPH
jgi:replicative DNA helicase